MAGPFWAADAAPSSARFDADDDEPEPEAAAAAAAAATVANATVLEWFTNVSVAGIVAVPFGETVTGISCGCVVELDGTTSSGLFANSRDKSDPLGAVAGVDEFNVSIVTRFSYTLKGEKATLFTQLPAYWVNTAKAFLKYI